MPRGVYKRTRYHKAKIAMGKENSEYRHSDDTRAKIGLGVKRGKSLKDLCDIEQGSKEKEQRGSATY